MRKRSCQLRRQPCPIGFCIDTAEDKTKIKITLIYSFTMCCIPWKLLPVLTNLYLKISQSWGLPESFPGSLVEWLLFLRCIRHGRQVGWPIEN